MLAVYRAGRRRQPDAFTLLSDTRTPTRAPSPALHTSATVHMGTVTGSRRGAEPCAGRPDPTRVPRGGPSAGPPRRGWTRSGLRPAVRAGAPPAPWPCVPRVRLAGPPVAPPSTPLPPARPLRVPA